MKKSLSQAVALATLVGATAAHAGAADPVVNPDGLGGALLYPIYTVENNNNTLVSVVNTTDDFKAVKVRFVEGKNSAEVLDFHLYMSPKDVWSGSIVPTSNGAKLVSNDKSCIPGVTDNDGNFPAEGKPFETAQIVKDEDIPGVTKSTPAELAARVRTGHFEVIEMATIADTADTKALREGIKHVEGVPGGDASGCNVIMDAWAGGLWNMAGATVTDRTNHTAGLAAPTGGLYGTGAVVNVPGGWAASYDAVALVGDAETLVSDGKTSYYKSVQHPRPGSIYPHLGTEATTTTTDAGGTVETVEPDAGIFVKLTDALSVSDLYNDYFIDPAYGAETDLVVTFPTKRFHTFVAVDLDGTNNTFIVDKDSTHPFDNRWNDKKKIAPVAFDAVFYDKDEQEQTFEAEDLWTSPRPLEKDSFDLNYETNVISLNGSNSFGTAGGVGMEFGGVRFNEGWVQISRGEVGVPAIGFANIVTKNGVSSDGALRNFAQTFKHKTAK